MRGGRTEHLPASRRGDPMIAFAAEHSSAQRQLCESFPLQGLAGVATESRPLGPLVGGTSVEDCGGAVKVGSREAESSLIAGRLGCGRVLNSYRSGA
jgi:hypothetical protein